MGANATPFTRASVKPSEWVLQHVHLYNTRRLPSVEPLLLATSTPSWVSPLNGYRSSAMAEILSNGAFNALTWTFTAVAIVITVLRLYARIHVLKGFGWDDGLILLGLVRLPFIILLRYSSSYSEHRCFAILVNQSHIFDANFIVLAVY